VTKKIDVNKVNNQLSKKYGKGVVSLVATKNQSRPYTLRFEQDNPSKTVMNGAIETVHKMTDISFFKSEAQVKQ